MGISVGVSPGPVEIGDLTVPRNTTAQIFETSVTNKSLSKDKLHPDDHAKQITDTPGFKPFTMQQTAICKGFL